MTAITIFNGLYCDADLVAKTVANCIGYQLVTDQDIIADAARLSGLEEDQIVDRIHSEASRQKGYPTRAQVISWLRLAIAERLAANENIVIYGYVSLLAPTGVDNILRVCLISETRNRIWLATNEKRCSKEEARQLLCEDDQKRADWTISVTDCNDPWSEKLYDIVIPVDATGTKQSAAVIVEQLNNAMEVDSEASIRKIEEFLLAARVQTELARKGHDISVSAQKNTISLCLNDHADILKSATKYLVKFVSGFEGVKDVEIGTGRRYNQTDLFDRGRNIRLSAHKTPDFLSAVYCAKETCDDWNCTQEDISLATRIHDALLEQGRDITVFVKNGFVSLTINSHRVMLETMSRNLSEFVSGLDGVAKVEIGTSRKYLQPDTWKRVRQNISRSLLCEDREFVMNLSTRLKSGGMEAACSA